MNNAALLGQLAHLFGKHDVELESDEDWLLTDGDFPAIQASWHEGRDDAPGRLDIDVVLSEERRIEHSVAGFGEGEAACRDALAHFGRSALHVLLAACWYVTDDRKLQFASWDIGVRTWDVFIGPLDVRGAQVTSLPALTDGLAVAVKGESLTPELHWIRLFCRHHANGDVATEALLDNEPWAAGDCMLKAIVWPTADTDYTAHCFVALDVRDY